MPFKSRAQKEYLRINEPEIYERWMRDYDAEDFETMCRQCKIGNYETSEDEGCSWGGRAETDSTYTDRRELFNSLKVGDKIEIDAQRQSGSHPHPQRKEGIRERTVIDVIDGIGNGHWKIVKALKYPYGRRHMGNAPEKTILLDEGETILVYERNPLHHPSQDFAFYFKKDGSRFGGQHHWLNHPNYRKGEIVNVKLLNAETFESPVSCKICGKTFDSFRGLNGHMNAHLRAETFGDVDSDGQLAQALARARAKSQEPRRPLKITKLPHRDQTSLKDFEAESNTPLFTKESKVFAIGLASGIVATIFGNLLSEFVIDRYREDPELLDTEQNS